MLLKSKYLSFIQSRPQKFLQFSSSLLIMQSSDCQLFTLKLLAKLILSKDGRTKMDSLNRSINSYQQTGVFKIIRMIVEGVGAIGEGMERQHDEYLIIKEKPPKKTD